jgi:hypothetical protein
VPDCRRRAHLGHLRRGHAGTVFFSSSVSLSQAVKRAVLFVHLFIWRSSDLGFVVWELGCMASLQ